MRVLPVLLSIPHGGTRVPVELQERLAIGEKEIFEDIDGFTQDIYDLDGKVRHVIRADIARTFVDPGREASDLPPENPDGVIKSHTCFGRTIFEKGREPDAVEIAHLLEKYYYPFHKRLQDVVHKDKNNLELCIDCHSMAETGPPISPDTGKPRPLFCLGNRFGSASSNDIAQRLKDCIVTAFEIEAADVTVNTPFAGGYITRHYGNNPIAWIQVEMNRKLYLREPWFDNGTLGMSVTRTHDLNARFCRALESYFL